MKTLGRWLNTFKHGVKAFCNTSCTAALPCCLQRKQAMRSNQMGEPAELLVVFLKFINVQYRS
jgi:hypothetical protein